MATLHGTDDSDTLYGTSGNGGNDLLDGGLDTDTLTSVEAFFIEGSNSAGNSLSGGSDDDSFSGNGGHDSLNGGEGDDSLRGGTGNDTYVVSTLDVIVELANEGVDEVRTP